MVAVVLMGMLMLIVSGSLVGLNRVAMGTMAAVQADGSLVDAATRIERDTSVTGSLVTAGSTQIDYHTTGPRGTCTDVVIANVGGNLVESTRDCVGGGPASTVVLARGVTVAWSTPFLADDGGEQEALIAWTAAASSTGGTLAGNVLLRP